ncbi:histidine kinase [Streptomyces pactum]|uniref:histidine kinase n=1 Tax=Streptomyces pactum TaxID=68249 RepID=UPI0036FC4FC2
MTGTATALAELLLLVATGLVLLFRTARRRAPERLPRPLAAGLRWLTGWERRRLARFYGHQVAAEHTWRRAAQYLAVRWTLGLLGALVLLAVLAGCGYASLLAWGWLLMDGGNWWNVLGSALGGVFLLFLALQGIVGVAALEGQLAHHFLGPSRRDALERRIEELATTRAGVVEAVHDERRRIERDLHDGVQQRLVALGMLLGRARRAQDAEKIASLVAQAHAESRQALTDLREVAWRVYPTVLDEAGLRAALETVAERSPVPVRLGYALPREPGPALRTVAYFVVSEAVTNAIKHSGASVVEVELTRWDPAAPEPGRTAAPGGSGPEAAPSAGAVSGPGAAPGAATGRWTVAGPESGAAVPGGATAPYGTTGAMDAAGTRGGTGAAGDPVVPAARAAAGAGTVVGAGTAAGAGPAAPFGAGRGTGAGTPSPATASPAGRPAAGAAPVPPGDRSGADGGSPTGGPGTDDRPRTGTDDRPRTGPDSRPRIGPDSGSRTVPDGRSRTGADSRSRTGGGPDGTTSAGGAGLLPGRPVLRVRITDDGRGGADPAGSGLLGLARRVAALDGRLRVDSPPGGPTTVLAELPDPGPGPDPATAPGDAPPHPYTSPVPVTYASPAPGPDGASPRRVPSPCDAPSPSAAPAAPPDGADRCPARTTGEAPPRP